MRDYTVYWRLDTDSPLLTRTTTVLASDSITAETEFCNFMSLFAEKTVGFDIVDVVMTVTEYVKEPVVYKKSIFDIILEVFGIGRKQDRAV